MARGWPISDTDGVDRRPLLALAACSLLLSGCGLVLRFDEDAAPATDASAAPDAPSPRDVGGAEAGPPPDATPGDARVPDAFAPDGSTVTRAALRLSAGTVHTCATVVGGDVYCWGSNVYGQVGDGTRTERWSPTGVGIAADSLGGSGSHTCTVLGGDVWCWGQNAGGQLGDGSLVVRASPVRAGVPNARQVCGNGSHSCALLDDGQIACWGWNIRGAIGSGVLGMHYTDAQPVPSLPLMSQVTCGAEHTCGRNASGNAFCWGRNDQGQLGVGSRLDTITPASVRMSGFALLDIDAGTSHTCAVGNTGAVYCWGRGTEGQLGTGMLDNAPMPTEVPAITTAEQVSAASTHTCARLSGGSVVCWGSNRGGQLGTGDGLDQRTPVTRVVGLTDAVDIRTGSAHSCALRSGGSVVCWGTNGAGQLGDGSTRSSVVPVDVLWR